MREVFPPVEHVFKWSGKTARDQPSDAEAANAAAHIAHAINTWIANSRLATPDEYAALSGPLAGLAHADADLVHAYARSLVADLVRRTCALHTCTCHPGTAKRAQAAADAWWKARPNPPTTGGMLVDLGNLVTDWLDAPRVPLPLAVSPGGLLSVHGDPRDEVNGWLFRPERAELSPTGWVVVGENVDTGNGIRVALESTRTVRRPMPDHPATGRWG